MKKKGKIKSMLLLACMIMSFWSITVFADEYTARYDLSEGSVTIDADGIYYISQTGSDATANTITVNSDCTIYLDGVNILVPKPDSRFDHSRPNPFNINGAYNVKIHIVDGSVNTLASEEGLYDANEFQDDTRLRCGSGRAALRVPEGAILTIYGDDGVLNAYGAQGHNRSAAFARAGSGAGIGGDGAWANYGSSVADKSGKITINGGVINAVGGESRSYWGAGGAGIGGGGGGYFDCINGGSSDSITINGGVVTAVSGSRRNECTGNAIGSGGTGGGENDDPDYSETAPVLLNGGIVTVKGLLKYNAGETFTIGEDAKLVVAEDTIVKNNGVIMNNGEIINNGQIQCNTHSMVQFLQSDATCTEIGYLLNIYKCGLCEKSFEGADGQVEIDPLDVIIPATGHDYRWVTDRNATSSEKGMKHEECRNCGDKKNYVDIPATGSDKTPVKDENKDNTDGATQNQGNSDNTKTPETGDNNVVGLWITFVLVSGLCVIVSMIYTKRKNN